MPTFLRDVTERQGCGFLDAGLSVDVSPVDGVHWEAEAHRDFAAVMARAVQGMRDDPA
ncbi:hypothetical protein roselon_00049 [Roseibacterium elongatum DSM 19469]|uniref:SGNH hydrolase-type esterase domain-containing protein n=1 Tax=Roseicyclus elongatus DSM 19469 TaxID=1294273 RepID=W8S1C4_9RHOB|nr:hypothetical protein roselon_00049 [Roseibacterium elongatum DSM 19469]